MTSIKQFFALLRMNLADLFSRLAPVLTIVIGFCCAVGVLVAMLAMGVGARRQAMGDARADRVVLRSTGAQSAEESTIPTDVAAAIANLPYIRRGADGHAFVLFEELIILRARTKAHHRELYVPLYGVNATLTEVIPEFRLVAGRTYRPGLREVIAGDLCERQFVNFEVGDQRFIHGSDWNIVGLFQQGHSQGTCVMYADAGSILSAFGRNSYNQIMVMLQSPDRYVGFAHAVEANPTFHLDAAPEPVVVARNFRQLNGILEFASYFVGTIMAIGATLGAVNSLYAIVDSRRRELATLRAIGFAAGTIVAATLVEAVLLALLGALLGGFLAWALFDGFSVRPFSTAFQMSVTPALLVLGVIWALAMGLLGGLLPAWSAARVSVSAAMRAV